MFEQKSCFRCGQAAGAFISKKHVCENNRCGQAASVFCRKCVSVVSRPQAPFFQKNRVPEKNIFLEDDFLEDVYYLLRLYIS